MILWRHDWLRGCLRGSWPIQEFIAVLDSINSTLAAVERYRPPSVTARTLVHDGLSMLNGFARGYRGHVGKVMGHVRTELRSILYGVLGGE